MHVELIEIKDKSLMEIIKRNDDNGEKKGRFIVLIGKRETGFVFAEDGQVFDLEKMVQPALPQMNVIIADHHHHRKNTNLKEEVAKTKELKKSQKQQLKQQRVSERRFQKSQSKR